jgi:serine/threonine protein kinase
MPRTDINYTALFIRQSLPFTARLSDFEFGHLLGAGNFGRVIKCFHKHSNRTFALKIIKKERFRGVRNVVEVRRERRVLEASNHPYIMKIHHTYQSPDRVYFLLDYLPGGELLRHTQRAPNHHFSESYCRFYLAQLVCALEYLRIHQLLHRDIKGDNLVLDEAGNLVLTDFGFAKKMRPGVANRTCCGTLAYIAPEMLVSSPQGYGYEVDWWSTGVVLFTILTGFFPFLKSKRKETIEAITTHALQFPPKPAVSPQAADLCSRLLEKVPSRRIRTLKQVKEHAWFNGFDWEGVESKSVRPPYRPLGSQADPPAATSTTPPPAGGTPAAAGGVGDQGGGQQPQPGASNKDDTLQRDIQDAAQVGYDVPDDFTDQQDVFGPLYAPQEAAGSNREDNSSESDNDDLETHYTKGLDRLLGGAPFTSILNAGMLGGGGGGPGASGGGWGGMDGSGSNRYQLSSNSLVAMS